MAGLPEPFADLEQFRERWALATTQERHRRRAASSMPELEAFYAAAAPRLEAALAFLDRKPIDALDASERQLLNLCLALADVALAVEKYRVPLLPDAVHSTRFEVDTADLG